MTKWPHLPKAPIVEALLDIRVEFSTPPTREDLDAFHQAIRDRYPTKLARVAWEGEIQLTEEGLQQASKKGPEGFLFKDKEGLQIVQARQDGFTFSRLKPYDRWESMRDEASKHWARYREMFTPEAVTRVALRYINRLELPLPFKDFREYVLTSPDIALGLPQGLQTFFMRLEIPEETRGLVGIVTETIEPVVERDGGRRLPFILDIDVIRPATFEPNSAAIWKTFEDLHEYKNEIFFKSITEKARSLCV